MGSLAVCTGWKKNLWAWRYINGNFQNWDEIEKRWGKKETRNRRTMGKLQRLIICEMGMSEGEDKETKNFGRNHD